MALLALQAGIILIATRLGAIWATRLRMPPVLGELLAGMAVGPFALGAIPLSFLGLGEGIFHRWPGQSMAVSDELYGLAMLGSILLLFVSGLETNLSQFFRYLAPGSVVGLGGAAASFLVGIGLGMWWFGAEAMDPRCLFMGILTTATSVGITARILSDKRKMDSPEGVTIMSAAVMDDVLGIICLAIVLNLAGPGAAQGDSGINWGAIGGITLKAFGVWVLSMAIGMALSGPMAGWLRKMRQNPVAIANSAAALAFLAGGLIEKAGLAMIIGSYVLGLSLSKTDIAFTIHDKLRGLQSFFVPLFFAVMGMLVDLRLLANPDVLGLGLLFAAGAILAKIIGCGLPSFGLKFNWLGGLRIGVGMVPRGEVALIIAGIGATTYMTLPDGSREPILNDVLFGATIIMTLLTTVAAPPLLAMLMAVARSGSRREEENEEAVTTRYDFSSARLTDLVFDHLVSSYSMDGYFVVRVDASQEYRVNKDDTGFTVRRDRHSLVFVSLSTELSFIRQSMLEAVADLSQSLDFLKNYATRIQQDGAPGAARPASAEGAAAAGGEAASADGKRKPNPPCALAVGASGDPPPCAAADFCEAVADAPKKTANSLSNVLCKILSKDCIKMNLAATTRDEAVRELIDLLVERDKLDQNNVGWVYNSVMDRVRISPTGLGRGLGFPHTRTDGIETTVAALGVAPQGIDFEAPDGLPAKIILLYLGPRTRNSSYLSFLTALSQRFSQIENVDGWIEAQTPDELMRRICGC